MNRRKMLALLGASPALVATTPSYASAAPKTAPKSASPMTDDRFGHLPESRRHAEIGGAKTSRASS